MKKLLNIKDVKILNKNSQKDITAGYSLAGNSRVFLCYCGFIGGSGQGYPFPEVADSINGALNNAGQRCGGTGATCQGF